MSISNILKFKWATRASSSRVWTCWLNHLPNVLSWNLIKDLHQGRGSMSSQLCSCHRVHLIPPGIHPLFVMWWINPLFIRKRRKTSSFIPSPFDPGTFIICLRRWEIPPPFSKWYVGVFMGPRPDRTDWTEDRKFARPWTEDRTGPIPYQSSGSSFITIK